jgi:twitching motility protein PilT
MLADTLKGVIAQTLCKKIDGGRIAAFEVLVVNTAVAALIREARPT